MVSAADRGPAFALPGTVSLAGPGAGAIPLGRPGRARTRTWSEPVPTDRAHVGVWTRVQALELSWVLTLVAVSSLALVMRLLNHSSDYDLFIDEITYSTIGQSVALGHGVSLYGTPFFLHPPLFFYLEAGVLDLTGQAHASPVNLVLDLRPLNCVIGALECGLTMMLIRRLASRPAAIVLGIFIACDPFVLLWDGRVLLETLAMTTAVAAWLCLDWVARRPMAVPRHEAVPDTVDALWTRAEWAMVILGGLLFGASLLSKETYGFVGIVPVAAMFVLGSPVRRRVSGIMFGVAAGCYVVYLATVAASGHLSAWWNQNVAGVLRAVGTKQITGFNQSGHSASVGSRIGAQLALYLISYLVITAVGCAALVGVIRWFRAARAGRRLSTQRRLAIVLGAGAIGYVGYAVVFGAFEVQIFYMGVIGGLPVLATEVGASRLRLFTQVDRRRVLISCAVLASLALAFEVAADVRLRSERDTALSQLVTYVGQHVHYPSLVDSTDGVSQFVLQGVRVDGPTTVAGLQRDRPDYVIVDAGLVNQGYNHLGRGFQPWLNAHARVVWQARGRSAGQILLYRTKYASGTVGAER